MQSKRKNVDKRKIFLWCAAAGIVLCAVLFCLWHNRTALAEQRVERALSVTVSQPEPRLAQEDNTETGAWITVPGTNRWSFHCGANIRRGAISFTPFIGQ